MTSRAYVRPHKFRYCLIPGTVTSQIDGDRQYITYAMLLALYGLDAWRDDVCVRNFGRMKPDVSARLLAAMIEQHYVLLGPRPAGDYRQHRDEQERRILRLIANKDRHDPTEANVDDKIIADWDTRARQALPPPKPEPQPGRYPGGRRCRNRK